MNHLEAALWWWCVGRMRTSEPGFRGIFMCRLLLPLFPLLGALQGVHVPWAFLPIGRSCHFQTYDSLRPSALVNLYLSLYLETRRHNHLDLKLITATSSSILFAPENPMKTRLWGMLPSDHHHQDIWHVAPMRISCDFDVTCSLMIFSILGQIFILDTCYFQRCPC